MKNIIIFGAPGSGKGTYSDEIVNKDAEQPVAITLEEAEAVAIRMLKDSPVFYTSDFAFKTRLSKHLSYKYLKQLTQKGVLKREGSKRLYAYTKA